ncbi:MAG: hypothetical protein KJ935_05300 [Candidatus Omnitrophica bacterium]|nr:hypothetical protein [Candidatus Omnitrophota bacterium]
MAVADIIKKILVEAEEKAGGILTQGRQDARRIRKEAEVRAQQIVEQIIQAKQDLSNQAALRIISLARLESKKAVLSARQRMLNQVFSDRRVRVKDLIEKIVVSFEGEKKEALEPEIYLKIRRPEYEARVAEILFKGRATSETDEK